MRSSLLDWLGSQQGVSYELQRAEEIFPELRGQLRWEFAASVRERPDWLALDVKALVIPEGRRQFNDWSAFCSGVTRQLQGRFQGELALMTSIPWTFSQADGKSLVGAFVEALIEAGQNPANGDEINLGSSIVARFQGWPSKPPTSDGNLWRERHIWKVIYPPEDLIVFKLDNSGCSVELGVTVGQAFEVDPTLNQAVKRIFQPRRERGAKSNE